MSLAGYLERDHNNKHLLTRQQLFKFAEETSFHEWSDSITHDTIRHVGLHVHGADWRWQRGRRIAHAGRTRYSQKLGPVIWHVAHHFRSLRESHRPTLLQDREVDVAGAVAIHGNRMMRLKVEARFLAGLSFKDVAARSGINEALARDYHDIFFDVQTRLVATGWIMQQIEACESDPTDGLRRTLLREAFHGGPIVCEHWLEHCSRFGEEHDLSTAEGRELERLELLVFAEGIRMEHSSARAMDHVLSMTQATPPIRDTVESLICRNVRKTLFESLDPESPQPSSAPMSPGKKQTKVA